MVRPTAITSTKPLNVKALLGGVQSKRDKLSRDQEALLDAFFRREPRPPGFARASMQHHELQDLVAGGMKANEKHVKREREARHERRNALVLPDRINRRGAK